MGEGSEVVEVQYLVLAERDAPYLLARVRWPDVAQAMSAGCPYWQYDPGLFDLPYDPSSTKVTLSQASAIAAGSGSEPRVPTDNFGTAGDPTNARQLVSLGTRRKASLVPRARRETPRVGRFVKCAYLTQKRNWHRRMTDLPSNLKADPPTVPPSTKMVWAKT